MSGKIVIQSSPVVNNRRQPLLPHENRINLGECAGSAAAECAVICCCCPCVIVECLVLAVYKVPIGICRRVWRNRLMRRRRKKKKGVLYGVKGGGSSTIYCFHDDKSDINAKEFEMIKVSIAGSAEVIDLDKEMWEQFHNTGFWRSPSQRHL